MSTVDVERLRQIKTLPSLVKFLRNELDWPIEVGEVDGLTFDYTSEELGLDEKHAVKIKEIKQLRPLDSRQPWGIFWVSFENKRLPMVVLRRILGNLVIKTRASARKTDRPSWHLHDLLFISSYGEEVHRTLSFAHFTEDPGTDELPVLRVLGWDDQNSIMHLDRVANQLHTHLRWTDGSDDVDAWRQRWSAAFTDRYLEAIRSADELIPRLAYLAANIRRRVRDVLDAETERGPMRSIFAAVQSLLIHDMEEDGFADMYAQTVAYGLLCTSFAHPVGLTAQNLVQLTAVSNPFLENLLENLFRLNRGKFHFDVDEVGINDVLDLLRNTNMEAIKAAFSDKNPSEDPVIRFYEGFLKQYDPEQRVKRGVFFTPRPVVACIVRSVHELLQTEFGLADGLASIDTWADMKKRFTDLIIPHGAKLDDPFVCILDPATGTGTFLFECIELIEHTMKEKWCRELGKKNWNDTEIIRRWREYVSQHLLSRLYGYEVMMAPYSIAHLKLSLKLGETSYQFHEGDRLHIYLTNSLERQTKLANSRLADMFSTLATEAQSVNEIKANKRFTVIIGNPPYAKSSQNHGKWIESLMEDYKHTVRNAETQIQALSDDYSKFIRIGHFILEQSQVGILGYITNNGYLDGPLFRDMRSRILSFYRGIRILNLHGDSRKRFSPPDGKADENVFDIQQGVAISLLWKVKLCDKYAQVGYSETWGTREERNTTLQETSVTGGAYQSLEPVPPHYLFIPVTREAEAEFNSGWHPYDVFGTGNHELDNHESYGAGFVTQQDKFAITFQSETLVHNVKEFLNPNSDEKLLWDRFEFCSTNQWSFERAKQELPKINIPKFTRRCLYRPFDYRYTVFDRNICTITRKRISSQFNTPNIALLITRRITRVPFNNVFVTNTYAEYKVASHDRNTIVFPLWIKDEADSKANGLFKPQSRLNLNSKFLEAVASAIGLKQTVCGGLPQDLNPEDIFKYIYSVFHSPTYRTRYAEFLKIDFPRLPVTSSLELFHMLAHLGGELVALHLMESPKLEKPITKWQGSTPSSVVEKVIYSDGTVWINKVQMEGFRSVPENVWNFHIGGYQICEKWLKDRKGRVLSADDISHYQKIVVALNETIRLMKEIDEVIEQHGGWPGAFHFRNETNVDQGCKSTEELKKKEGIHFVVDSISCNPINEKQNLTESKEMEMPEFDAKKMNDAANDASLEFENLRETYPDAVKAVEDWAKKWVPSAGYKRLAKVLAGRWE